jgi:asparagine synthase (glutamine-hydrolysing)
VYREPMCGIAGMVGTNIATERAGIAARDQMVHRGPDGAGIFRDEGCLLTHVRLAILDPTPAGAQPMFSEDERFVLVYNGEIYNYPELREELSGLGIPLRSQCDTEALLHLLTLQGRSVVHRLNGIFALALWDRRDKRLFLARDHFGVKPLYFSVQGESLAFASESKSLHAMMDIDRTVDPRRALQVMSFGWVPEPFTMFPSIQKLPPGHWLEWQDGKFRVHKYWDMLDWPNGTFAGTYEDAVEETRTQIDAAVSRQLLSDVPVGAFLSGGIDSSVLVARMAETQKVSAYTVQPGQRETEGFAEDYEYALEVAQALGVDLHRIEIDSDLANMIPHAQFHLDDPIADPAAVNTFHICKLAHSHGSIVVLSGQGGDELYGGYARHLALLATRLPSFVPSFGGPSLGTSGTGFPFANFFRRARRIGNVMGMSPARRYGILSMMINEPASLYPVLSEAWLAQSGDFDPLGSHISAFEAASDRDMLSRALYTDVQTFMPSLNLLYTDKMGMAASVEVRVPYLDLELARSAWSLPSRFKIRGLQRKRVLKDAARPWVPSSVINRAKRGFGAPVRDWMRGGLADFSRRVLTKKALSYRGWFDPVATHAYLDDHVAGRADHGYQLYAMVSLELWARQHLDGVAIPAR